MLIVDGHKQVMDDKSIISKSNFLRIAGSLIDAIRTFRCNFHHLNAKPRDKSRKRLGELYRRLAGKNVLDDPSSKLKFQKELLKWTATVLRNEYEMVNNTVESFKS